MDELTPRDHGDEQLPAGAAPGEVAAAEPTIFTLLAERARQSPGGHLVAAAVLGGTDAALFGRAHPGLWWIAAGSVMLAAYGCWGLADRALARDQATPRRRLAFRVLRDGATVVGSLAALGVVFGFLGAALGGWIH